MTRLLLLAAVDLRPRSVANIMQIQKPTLAASEGIDLPGDEIKSVLLEIRLLTECRQEGVRRRINNRN